MPSFASGQSSRVEGILDDRLAEICRRKSYVKRMKHSPGGNGRAVKQMPQHARGAAPGNGLLDGVVRVIVADRAWHYARALSLTMQLEHDLDVVGVAYGIDELLEFACKND